MATKSIENLFVDAEGTKTCTRCSQVLSRAMFTKNRNRTDGFSAWCKNCFAKKQKDIRHRNLERNSNPLWERPKTKKCCVCRETKPGLDFSINKYNADGLDTTCKKCASDRGKNCYQKSVRDFSCFGRPKNSGNKICSRCGHEKPRSEFYNQNRGDGRVGACKSCYDIDYKAKSRNLSFEQFITYAMWAARKKCLLKALCFDISVDDVLVLWNSQSGKCAYTGIAMTHRRSKIGSWSFWTNVTIDRIDNSIGYTRDNILLCCNWANRAKSSTTMDDFKRFIQMAHSTLCVKEVPNPG